MKKSIKRVLFIISILVIMLQCQDVFAETLEERLNNLIGPQEQYNTMLSPVYLRNNALEESISAQSGELSLAQTDYVIPGRKGLDLEIKRLYKSGISNVKEMKVKYVNGAWIDYVQADANTSSFYEDRYNLGIGMRFSFAGIEIRNNDDGTSHKFLHTEAGDVYRLTGPTIIDGVRTYLPENQTIKDVVIVEDNSFSNGQADGTSFFMMRGNDGKKTYFSQDGRILGIVDRYENIITFEYTTQIYTVDGVTRTKRLISRITDTVGRVVTIEYKEDYSYKIKEKDDVIYGKDESYKQSQNPNNTDSGDLDGKFQVIIHLPGNKRIIYDKSAVLVGNNKNIIRTRLQRVYDVDGRPKFHYWYEQTDLGFTYTNGSNYSVYNRYENLVQIDFVKTNQIKRYTYDTYTRKLADNGSMQYRKIFEKKEMSKRDYDITKANFLDRFICDVKSRITYTYTNEADGYGFSGYNGNDETYLKDTYRYSTKISYLEGTIEKYHEINTYNGLHELVSVESNGTGHREVTITEYDEMKFPKKKETLIYNVANGKQFGDPIIKIENYRYDEFGNLTNYTGPIANRDSAGYPVDTEHTVIYSYAYDKYHVPQLKTWKNDADTICQIKYDIDEKGNVLRETKVLGDNPDVWPVTDFSYDTYGNLIKKEVRSQENTYITNYEYGIDINGIDHKGAYLTRQYTVADGKEISAEYAYDHNTGGIIAEKDGNNNLIRYEYDVLGRVIRQIQPDGTVKQYDYFEYPYSNKQVIYTDPEGTKLFYEYDIAGNLLEAFVYDNGSWHTLKKLVYDSNNNKIKEIDANGHSVRFEYNSQNKLIKRSNYENDTVKKSEMILSYTYQIDGNSVLQVAITDEEGFVQKYFYDANDKLVKTMMTPDNVIYYTNIYEYDYVGNNIRNIDAANNETIFEYDQLGCLISTTNAKGHITKNTYNVLDKMLAAENPGGRITEYVYDDLARVVMEKVYIKGSDNYSYKKYVYDNNGNIITQIQGSVKAGADTIHTWTDNKYNAMNLVTDQYIKIDEENTFHIQNAYDKNGRKIRTLEFADKEKKKYREYNYTYDFAGRLLSEEGTYKVISGTGKINEYGNSCKRYEYDYAGNIKKLHVSTDSGFITSTFLYDYNNRLILKTEPYTDQKTKETKYTYDKKGNLLSEILTVQGKKSIKSFIYDGLGRVIEQISPEGGITRYIYDERNNLVKEIRPEYYGMPVNSAPGLEYAYDELNRQYKITAYDGTSREVITYREFDERGNLIKEADSFGYNKANPTQSVGVLYEYDENDNVVKYISAQTAYENKVNGTDKFTAKNEYDGACRLISSQDAYGGITVYEYYMNGKLKQKQNPDGSKEYYSYDLSGRIEEAVTDARGNTKITYYNIFGKPYRIEYPDGTFETFEYSRDGNLVKSFDRSGNVKIYEYDKAGNMTARKEYVSSDAEYDWYRLIAYTYDEAGNKLSEETFEYGIPKRAGAEILTSAGDRVNYEYDRESRLIKIIGPAGRQIINQYNLSGNIIKQLTKTDNNYFDVKRFSYDFRGRLISETLLVEAGDIHKDYLIGVGYDNEFASRVVSRTEYQYYGNGKLKSKKDGSGNITSYEYNLDGKVTSNINALNQSTVYKYDSMGNLVQQTDPRGNSTWFEYDSMSRLIGQMQPAADGGLAVTRYIYDDTGNLIKQIQPNEYDISLDTPELAGTMRGVSYTYDSMNRKTSTLSSDDEILELIVYDANGNAKKVIDGLRYDGNVMTSAGTEYAYDGLNRVIAVTDALGNTTAYEYDISGNLVKQTDARNNEYLFEYNSDKTLKKAVYPDGGTVEYTYDCQGRMIEQKDQRGNITTYSYNAFGKVRTETDPYGNTIAYKYDLNGNLVSIKDKRDSTTLMKYDALDRLIEKRVPLELDASGNVIYSIEKYTYDAAGNLVKKTLGGTRNKLDSREVNYTYYQNNLLNTVTDSAGGYTKNYYDKNGNIIKILTLRDEEKYDIQKYEYDVMNRKTKDIKLSEKDNIFNTASMAGYERLTDPGYPDMIAVITAYEYDILGNLIKEILPKAFEYAPDDEKNIGKYIISYDYDALNRLERVTRKHNGLDVSATYQYDELGNRIRAIDELGNETTYAYDSMSRIISYTDACGNTFSYTYDKAGNKLTETNPKSNTMTYTYDKLNRLKTVTDPYNTVITTNTYDANGNLIEIKDAKGYTTKYTYDLSNRAVKVTDPEAAAMGGYTVSYEYNQYGEKIKEIDGLGNAISYEYDNAGRLVKVTDALGISTKYSYDKAGNKLSMTDGRGITTNYGYGSFGKMTSMVDADGKTALYSYDLMGNMACETDRNGNILIYSYDNRGNLTEKINANMGDIIAYSYDPLGNRTGMIDQSGESSYLYDGNNRLLRVIKDGITQLAYTYDSIGNMESVTDVKGFMTSYTYDKANRMETVSYDGRTVTYTYDFNGNRESVTYPAGIKEEYKNWYAQ